MATRASGQVLERRWKRGRGYALRFRAYGKRRYLTLGFEEDGWTQERAEEELANVMADVRRGIWTQPEKSHKAGPDAERHEVPIFGPFARELIAARRGEVTEGTIAKEEWALGYLLGFFADWPLSEIDVQAVDGFRRHMVAESESRRCSIERRQPKMDRRGNPLRPLSPSSINQQIDFLQSVLSIAHDYGHVKKNAAVGRRRRLRVSPKRPVHLDSASSIEALLRAAEEMDQEPRFRLADRLPILATLIFAGPRASELGHLPWRDVNLAVGRIEIGRSKTQAGFREIRMKPILLGILTAHKANSRRTGPDDLVFPTANGGRRDARALLSQVLRPVVKRADELLISREEIPLPKGLTTHKLRHTFASIMIALGEDPITVMTQIGHTDPAFTLRVYTHMMNRDPEERANLKALVEGQSSTEAPTARRLQCGDYEKPILKVLTALGGSATRPEIAKRVRDELAPRMTSIDLERVPSGMPRWETHLSKARSSLVSQGWIKPGSPRGLWELSDNAGVELPRFFGHLKAFS